MANRRQKCSCAIRCVGDAARSRCRQQGCEQRRPGRQASKHRRAWRNDALACRVLRKWSPLEHDRSEFGARWRPGRRGRRRASPEGSVLPRLYRSLGAIFLLWNDRAARPLHGESAAAAGTCRAHCRIFGIPRCARIARRSTVDAGTRFADFRSLLRIRLLHAAPRRHCCRPLDRTAQCSRDRGAVDERRSCRHDFRCVIPPGSAVARCRLGLPQGQYLGSGRCPLSARRRSASHAWLHSFQHGHQCRCGYRSAAMRLARAGLRLALRLRHSGGLHAGRPRHVSFRVPPPAGARGTAKLRGCSAQRGRSAHRRCADHRS